MNPYSGVTFFEFFPLFFQRLLFERSNLVSDEIQCFVLTLVGVTCAFLGTFLVLRKMTMIANAISHTILVGIALSAFIVLGTTHDHDVTLTPLILLVSSLLCGLLTGNLVEILHRKIRLQEDASIGLVFTSFFSLGIIVISALFRNSHVGTDAIFGNADSLTLSDLTLCLWTALLSLLFVGILYKELLATSFDLSFAKALGIPSTPLNYALMGLTSAACVAGFRAVGVMCVLSFMASPALCARLYAKSLSHMLLLSSLIACIAALSSVALSRHIMTVFDLSVSTAGLASTVVSLIFIIVILFAPKRWRN